MKCLFMINYQLPSPLEARYQPQGRPWLCKYVMFLPDGELLTVSSALHSSGGGGAHCSGQGAAGRLPCRARCPIARAGGLHRRTQQLIDIARTGGTGAHRYLDCLVRL